MFICLIKSVSSPKPNIKSPVENKINEGITKILELNKPNINKHIAKIKQKIVINKKIFNG